MGSRLVLNLREAYYRNSNGTVGRVSLGTTFNHHHSVLQSVCFVEPLDDPLRPRGGPRSGNEAQIDDVREDSDEEGQGSTIYLRNMGAAPKQHKRKYSHIEVPV